MGFGIKIPGIHFQDQKYSNDNVKTRMEVMKQCQRICNIKQAKYSKYISKIVLKGSPGRTQGENCMKPRGTIRIESTQIRWFS
jgi:hypothetical protein